jgi:hypothetical protein
VSLYVYFKGIDPHMYCWSPLPLIFIEEEESPLLTHHYCTLSLSHLELLGFLVLLRAS